MSDVEWWWVKIEWVGADGVWGAKGVRLRFLRIRYTVSRILVYVGPCTMAHAQLWGAWIFSDFFAVDVWPRTSSTCSIVLNMEVCFLV